MDESISVLHVEDEPEFAELVDTFLERQNDRFDIDVAHRADDGLERLRKDEFDCVVSDYDMPGQNGIEFLRTVRSRWAELPFILYTGKGSEEVASDAISAGATDYIQKESGSDHFTLLANRIENVVEHHQAKANVKRTDERYHNLVDTAPIPIMLFDTDGRMVYANDEAVEFFDADSHAELEDVPFTKFLHADDKTTATDRFERLMSEGKHAPEIEYRIKTLGGETRSATVATAYGYYQGERVAQAMVRY